MKQNSIYIGIDPGPVNTGWCVRGVDNDNLFLACGVFDPRATGDVIMSAESLFLRIEESMPQKLRSRLYDDSVQRVAAIERFVSYKGVLTNNVEDTCMFIGSLTFLLRTNGINTTLARAITWKPKVCSKLHLDNGFNNPSTKLDKKFSNAAACSILGVEEYKKRPFKTDHEADAICLSYFAENFV